MVSSGALVSGGGGGARGAGGASSGIGDIAAAALAARRDKRIDTVVLAKCRRKSQTMWPARLCSKREVCVNGWVIRKMSLTLPGDSLFYGTPFFFLKCGMGTGLFPIIFSE